MSAALRSQTPPHTFTVVSFFVPHLTLSASISSAHPGTPTVSEDTGKVPGVCLVHVRWINLPSGNWPMVCQASHSTLREVEWIRGSTVRDGV